MNCARFNVSDRAGAATALSGLQRLKSDTIIDKSKIKKERSFAREKKIETQNKQSAVQALYFDGRKDKTLKETKKHPKHYKEVTVEEHICL